MLGLSYGEILLIIGATAAVVGPKDLPIIARAGRKLFGRAIGYINMARGHLDGVMKQPQMQEISKEVQDLRAQVDAISHGARFSLFDSSPLTRRVDNHSPESSPSTNGNVTSVDVEVRQKPADHYTKAQEFSGSSSASFNLHAQATSFARLSETVSGKTHTLRSDLPVLPVSAEMAKLLPQRKGRKNFRVFIMKRFVLHTSMRKFWTILYSLSLETEVVHFIPNNVWLQRVQEDLI